MRTLIHMTLAAAVAFVPTVFGGPVFAADFESSVFAGSNSVGLGVGARTEGPVYFGVEATAGGSPGVQDLNNHNLGAALFVGGSAGGFDVRLGGGVQSIEREDTLDVAGVEQEKSERTLAPQAFVGVSRGNLFVRAGAIIDADFDYSGSRAEYRQVGTDPDGNPIIEVDRYSAEKSVTETIPFVAIGGRF